jgi:hypothetical protein
MLVTRLGRKLLRDTRGQVMLFGIILMVALLAFMLLIPNGTQVATQKMRAQTAADAGAYTGSVWLARSLNLSANMNIGVRSVHTWMTVLTMGAALASALNTDSFDVSVRQLGSDIAYALFNNYDPVAVAYSVYPVSIESLSVTEQWLQELQDDVAVSLPVVGQEIAAAEARRTASGGNPASENPGAEVLILTNSIDTLTGDTISMLVETPTGDSLLYSDLIEVAASLESIPTMDENIGPATGLIFVDTATMDISAYYGTRSQWLSLKQIVTGLFVVRQWYDPTAKFPAPGIAPESTKKFFHEHKPTQWMPYVGYSATGQLTKWIDPQFKAMGWYAYGRQGYATPKPGDSIVAHIRHWKLATDPTWAADTGLSPACTIPELMPYIDSGMEIIWSGPDSPFETDFYVGAESTDGHLGSKVRPRRLNPDREFHAVSYVWRTGADTSPRGPGPRYGGGLFNRGGVPAPMPMVTVARSVPFLAINSPTEEDYFFSPNWDVRLTLLDEAALQDIATGEAYAKLGIDSLNLEELRKYVLLP